MWNNVNEVPAPKDRPVMVTKGFAWNPTRRLSHPMRGAQKTIQEWSLSGMIIIAMWYDEDGSDGAFVNPANWSLVPEFDYWCDIQNPLTGMTVDPLPPRGLLTEVFEGDATREDREARLKKDEAFLEKLVARNETDAVIMNSIDRLRSSISQQKEDIEKSYYAPTA